VTTCTPSSGVQVVEFPFQPLPIHLPFHASRARVKAAIGGVGSGKTRALCMEATRFALAQPGSDMILTRRTVPDLRRTTEKELFEALPDELVKRCKIVRLGGHVESITFPNHSMLTLVGMEDWTKHKSMNLAWIGIDEASEQTRDNIEGIENRLRQTKPLKGAPPLARGERMVNQMVVASNPAGQDHLYDMYVNPATRRGDCSLHLSTPMDNPYLPAEYFDFLLQMPVPYIRRFVECRFDAAAGRVYEEWAWDTHVLRPRKPGGFGKTIWMGMDPGVLAPTAGLWAEVDTANHRLVVVREYQEAGRAADAHAKAWRRIEAGLAPARVSRRIADPNITKRDQGTTMELADIYGRLGFNFEKGPVRHDVRIPALANAIASYEFVCTEDCPNLYEQILNARWEDQAPRLRDLGDFKEKIRKGNDHEHDVAQYLASIHVPGPPRAAAPAPAAFNQPLRAASPAFDMAEVEDAWHTERLARLKQQVRGFTHVPPRDGVLY
jgi:phage terminase large subunit